MAERLEGGGASQLVQLIQTIGYNKDVDIELATVIAPPPALKIRIDNMNIDLEADDIIVSQHLCKHTRKMKITASGTSTVYSDEVSGRTPNSDTPPWEDVNIKDITLANGNLTVTEATVEYLDELKSGDRVIVASINDGQSYVILDRAVTY